METGLKSELLLAMSCLCQEYSTEMIMETMVRFCIIWGPPEYDGGPQSQTFKNSIH
jgi:hypothetical protein